MYSRPVRIVRALMAWPLARCMRPPVATHVQITADIVAENLCTQHFWNVSEALIQLSAACLARPTAITSLQRALAAGL